LKCRKLLREALVHVLLDFFPHEALAYSRILQDCGAGYGAGKSRQFPAGHSQQQLARDNTVLS
jgi:hypothetical protein